MPFHIDSKYIQCQHRQHDSMCNIVSNYTIKTNKMHRFLIFYFNF